MRLAVSDESDKDSVSLKMLEGLFTATKARHGTEHHAVKLVSAHWAHMKRGAECRTENHVKYTVM